MTSAFIKVFFPKSSRITYLQIIANICYTRGASTH